MLSGNYISWNPPINKFRKFQMYHVASSLYVMMNPIFCFFQVFVQFRKTLIFILWTLLNLALVTFIFVCALVSVKITGFGQLLCVITTLMINKLPLNNLNRNICWSSFIYSFFQVVFSLCSGLISWERTAIADVLRESSSEIGLFWCGAFTQIGAFFGAILMFLLINVAHIFS